MAKKKTQRNARKKKRFQMLHPNMTRTEWAREKEAKKQK